ncbi:hypothetical protein HanRHA438_Chr14g0653031 [Helianthus annuus]|nr:hypothetical protein HanRHA438_Chr14g0653031 [Helianthus annuus]
MEGLVAGGVLFRCLREFGERSKEGEIEESVGGVEGGVRQQYEGRRQRLDGGDGGSQTVFSLLTSQISLAFSSYLIISFNFCLHPRFPIPHSIFNFFISSKIIFLKKQVLLKEIVVCIFFFLKNN